MHALEDGAADAPEDGFLLGNAVSSLGGAVGSGVSGLTAFVALIQPRWGSSWA